MIEIPDVTGRAHRFESPPSRVVSLVPSLTETLFDLGLGGSVVGVTEFCIFPSEVAALARVGGTKNPDVDAIRELAPDLVYVNLEENLARHAEAIAAFARVFATEPKSVMDVAGLIETLGVIHGAGGAAAEWNRRLEALMARAPFASFRFAVPIWRDPWMWCGGDTYVSDLVSLAGGTNVLAGKRRYPRHTPEEIASLAPDIVFLPDEPYEFDEADATELSRVSRVIGPFPGHLFTWHGTRTVAGLEFLALRLDEAE
ncbi:MAG: helical backbone metal receptor [Thermoanaerobaculia bacterium]